MEGSVDFRAILFIPKHAPFDIYNTRNKVYNKVKLYVRKVFIAENLEELLPDWLNFVSGIVDCHSLPLNVSREMLQKNRYIKIIKKQLTKKILSLISNLDDNKYKDFWKQFGKNIKLGIHMEPNLHKKLLPLLRFHTNKSKDLYSLDDYIKRMNDNQKNIYYLTGESLLDMKISSFISRVGKNEVILFDEVVDEYMTQELKTYNEYNFVDIAKDNKLNLSEKSVDDDNNNNMDKLEEFKTFTQEFLKDKILSIKFNNSLNTSCIILSSQQGINATMENIIKNQTMRHDSSILSYMKTQKILEINPNNKLISNLITQYNENKDNKTVLNLIKNTISILFETALLKAGYSLNNKNNFIYKVEQMILLNFDNEDFDIEEFNEEEFNEEEFNEEDDMEHVD